LDYKDNSITILYSAPFYEKANANRFSYVLEGFKDEWSPWTNETKAVYTNLSEGEYIFTAKARNVFSHQSSEARYRFIILPPWFRTVPAYLFYITAFLLLLYVGIRLYEGRLIAAGKRLEQTVAQRTAELKEKTHTLEKQNTEIKEQAEKLKNQNLEIKQQALELEKEREAANAASHAKSMFLARMSHEIRTPINGVIGFSEMLMDTSLNEEQADYAGTIARSGEALLTLVNDILDFSKIEAGMLNFERLDFDLEVMAFDICHIILPRISEKPVEVLCRIGDEVPAFVKGDPDRFRQVLVNLMGNAAKFTLHGEIELSINIHKEKENELIVHAAVRDTGIGIPEEKQAEIFEEFQQADDSTTRKYGGTGLGLSICQQIVKLMGGYIRVKSEPGIGSIFHVYVPMEKSTKRIPAKPPSEMLAGKRVLIADDNENNLIILAGILEKFAMPVISLNSGEKVMPALVQAVREEAPIDICILDIQMPGMSGFDVARQIRAHSAHSVNGTTYSISSLPLLAFSSSTVKQSQMVLDSGFNAYLPKPIPRYKLKKMLKRLLGCEAEAKNESSQKDPLLTRYTLEEEAKHSVRILLVEDNPINRKLAKLMLSKAGYTLETAVNGREAVDRFTADPGRFDLIFMDVNMPEMDGRLATATLREKGFTDIPIIAVTADALLEDRQKCLAAGMNDYISKPIKREIVFKMVKKWTGDRSQCPVTPQVTVSLPGAKLL
ncbi:MAG: response regulator, partial [bacterium]|nr:response regulator [bacterium]